MPDDPNDGHDGKKNKPITEEIVQCHEIRELNKETNKYHIKARLQRHWAGLILAKIHSIYAP